MTIIKLQSGYEFSLFEKDFSKPKPLDKMVSRVNLIEINNLLSEKVCFGLMYGTLLGAIREGDFIEYDTDIDLFILAEDRSKFISLIPTIISSGYKVCRFEDELISIIKDDVYIDFYFFKKRAFRKRYCTVGLTITPKFVEKLVKYNFLGEEFFVPMEYEKALIELYGKSWKVPMKNKPSMDYNKYIIFRGLVHNYLPLLFKLVSRIKNWKK